MPRLRFQFSIVWILAVITALASCGYLGVQSTLGASWLGGLLAVALIIVAPFLIAFVADGTSGRARWFLAGVALLGLFSALPPITMILKQAALAKHAKQPAGDVATTALSNFSETYPVTLCFWCVLSVFWLACVALYWLVQWSWQRLYRGAPPKEG